VFNGESCQWKHGLGGFSTSELTKLPAAQLTNPLIDKAKNLLGAMVTNYCPDDILARYPESDSRIVFKGVFGLLRVWWQQHYGEEINDLTPVATCDGGDYKAAEYAGGRVVILWTEIKQIGAANCEVREGIE
jgi:hypothetical protein